jgi:multimeric flavodoxin WrbA
MQALGKEQVTILGISGTPIAGGNVEHMVRKALDAAESVGGVRTELISFHKKRIRFCLACDDCLFTGNCVIKDDDMGIFYEMLHQCDGLLIGVPVYLGSLPGEVKTFIDRCRRYTHGPMENAMRFKPGAVLTTAWFKHDGQELTTIPIHTFMNYVQMIIVGAKAYGHRRTPFVGALAHSTVEGRGRVDKSVRENVRLDALGMDLCEDMGKRVAILAKVVKAGRRELGVQYPFPDESLVIPRRRKEKQQVEPGADKPS